MSARASPLLGLGGADGAGWMAIYGAAGGQSPLEMPGAAAAPVTPPATDDLGGMSDCEYEQEYFSDEESEDPELIDTPCCVQRPSDAEILPPVKCHQPALQPLVNGQMGHQAVQPSPPEQPAFALTQFPISTTPCTNPYSAMPSVAGPVAGALPPYAHPSSVMPHTATLNTAAGAAAPSPCTHPSGVMSHTAALNTAAGGALFPFNLSSATPSKVQGAGVPSPAPPCPAPAHEQAAPGAHTPEAPESFPTYISTLNKVRKYLGEDCFMLTREACKELQQNAVRAIVFWKVVNACLKAHERDLLLDEMEYMDIQSHHNANTSKNEWRNQFNYLCHFVRWIAAYSILCGVTVEQAAKDIQDTKGCSNFETWKNRASYVLPQGSAMRMAWDKVGCRSPDTDKRTRDRLEMYAAGCAVYVEL